MSDRLETAPDRGLKIRTVRPKSGRMATLREGHCRQKVFSSVGELLHKVWTFSHPYKFGG